ncbi:MAG: segregation/condensation protein A [Anaerolineae bacterium]|nr:segregation/condensation protein A [Anaerolineae bacterium]
MSQSYRVQLSVFDGPLDLLLHLIEEQALDITVVALGQVTDQFLAYVRTLETPDPRLLADFLDVGAKLVLIKSRSLLPRPPAPAPDEEGEEDVGEALARQLREYQQYKRLAAQLQAREAAGLHTFTREAPPPDLPLTLGLEGVTLSDLVTAVRRALARLPATPPPGLPVRPHTVTIETKMAELRDRLSRGPLAFHSWLDEAQTRYEVIASFLALLELVKQQAVHARQSGPFADIWLEPLPPRTL